MEQLAAFARVFQPMQAGEFCLARRVRFEMQRCRTARSFRRDERCAGLFIREPARTLKFFLQRLSKQHALGKGTKAKNGAVTAFEVKVGDTVLIGRFSGSEVKLDEQKYTLVREDDILGVIA